MTIRYSVVDIKMSEHHTQRVTVGPWEVPILEVVHGGRVKHIENVELERAAPHAQAEFERLANKYRNGHPDEVSSKLPYVEQVYGQFGAGVAALEKAIQSCVVQPTAGKIDMEFKSAAIV